MAGWRTAPYLLLYRATARHVARPWLGTMAAGVALTPRDSLILTVR